jgi:hypothetical protein
MGLGWTRAEEVERPLDAFAVDPNPSSGPADPGTAGHPGHFPGQAIVMDVVESLDGFVAVGFVGSEWRPIAWRSRDAHHWTLAEIGRPTPAEAAFAVAAAALPGGEVLAIGRAGKRPAVWRTVDGGTTWSHTEPPVLGQPDDWERMTAVAAAGEVVVAGGSVGPELLERTARFWISADGGASWETTPDIEGAEGTEVSAILSIGVGWLALGRTGDGQRTTGTFVWQSADGRSWARIDATSLEGAWARAVARRADGSLVAVGTDLEEREAVTWTAGHEGTVWIRARAEESRLYGDGDKIRMMDVVEIDGELVAVGNVVSLQYGQGMGWTSTDGRSWVRSPNQPSLGQGEPLAVIGAGSEAIAVGSAGAPDNYIPRVWLSPPPG